MRRKIPEAIPQSELDAAIAESRVSSADVDSHFRTERRKAARARAPGEWYLIREGEEPRRWEPERSEGLGSSLIQHLERGDRLELIRVGCDPELTADAWDAARPRVPSAPKPFVPLPVDPLPEDVLLDPVRVRIDRVRDTVRAQGAMITDRLSRDTRRWKLAFLTLTYASGVEWAPGHITKLTACMKQWAKRRGFVVPYVWVAELGEQGGRLHYHLCAWLPRGLSMPKPDKQGWWPYGMTKIEWARKQNAAAGYLAKYMTKGGSGPGAFPPGCRIHGAGGLALSERLRIAWGKCPAYVREVWPDWKDRPARALGGGWCSRVTGELIEALFKWVGFSRNGRAVIRRAEPVSVVLEVGAWLPEALLPVGLEGLSQSQLDGLKRRRESLARAKRIGGLCGCV